MKKILLLFILIPNLLFAQTQIGNDIDGTAANDWCGRSVALNANGNLLAVASLNNIGKVRVFMDINYNWVQYGQDILEGPGVDLFGYSISLNSTGNLLAIGSRENNTAKGFVRIYKDSSGYWVQYGQDIYGENNNDNSASSIAFNSLGNRIIIGAPKNDGNGTSSGHARIYQDSLGNWVQYGQDIDGEDSINYSGGSVSMNAVGDKIAIGATTNINGNGIAGHVRVYRDSVGYWVQYGQDIDGETTGDHSGSSVSMNATGDKIAIGAPYNDGNGSYSGHVRVYHDSNGYWIQYGQDIDGESTGDRSGWVVSLNDIGDRLAISATWNNGPVGPGVDFGHVRLYKDSIGHWVHYGQDIDGEVSQDESGFSMATNATGNRIAIGSVYNSAGGLGASAGHVRVFDTCTYRANLGNDTSICLGDTLILRSTNLNSSYVWQDNSTDSIFKVYQTGIYWIEVNNASSCKSYDTIFVQVNSLPSIDLGNDTTLCQGDTLTLNATSANVNYVWQNNSTDSIFRAYQSGLYWVRVTDQCGSHADSIYLTFASPPIVHLGVDTTFCKGDTIELNPLVSNAQYLWQDNSVDSIFSAYQDGLYWITVSQNGCIVSDTINLEEIFKPNVSLNGDTVLCTGEKITLKAYSDKASYLWQDGSNNSTYIVSEAGIYSVEVTNACGLDTGKVNIHYIDKPILDLGSDTAFCTGAIEINAYDVNISKYLWSDFSTTSFIRLNKEGLYWLEAENKCGISRDSITINNNCDCKIFIPNAFTPNNDSRNETFKPVLNCEPEFYLLAVYNRWWQVVFSTTSPTDSWNGNFKNEKVDAGNYFYVLVIQNPNERKQVRRGNIIVIR